jgi:nitroreductase / dihydropteridine reductase
MSLNNALHWRYAPKRMTGEQVSEEQIEAILKAAQYAPTSMGLQPFHLYLIQDEALRKKIQPIAYNQPQITESSHLLIFSAYTQLAQHHIDDYIQNIIDTRAVTRESLAPFYASMNRFAQTQSSEQIKHWAANQTYIALGFALAEAALLGVDVTPMEGFDAAVLDDLFDFPKQHLTSVALLAIGFRDEENDFLSKEKKVRRSIEHLVRRF